MDAIREWGFESQTEEELSEPHAGPCRSSFKCLPKPWPRSSLNPNLTQAFADPALQPGDWLLVVGTVTEPGPVIIPLGWSGTIIGSPAKPGTIQQSAPGACDPLWGGGVNCMIDARQRGGLVQIIGLRFLVPNAATGIQAIGWPAPTPQPLTIKNCRFQGATSTAVFSGIVIGAAGGPTITFRIERNVISGRIGDTAIAVVGNGTTANVQIRWNQITIVDASSPGLGVGIGLTGLVSGGSVLVERNRINGGGATADALAGIALSPFFTIPTTTGAPGAIVRRNTILNFSDQSVTSTPFPPLRGTGIAFDTSAGVQILANLIKDNADGVAADPLTAGSSAGPPLPMVNDNNITCTNVPGCVAAGFQGVVLNPGAYNLNAEMNWWGSSTGPSGGAGTCPGSGLPVVPACGTAAGQVDVTPFRTTPNPNAGA